VSKHLPEATPQYVQKMRERQGHTYAEAGAIVHVTATTFWRWEQPRGTPNARHMPKGLQELYLLKCGEIEL
jgi:hypothetical protein